MRASVQVGGVVFSPGGAQVCRSCPRISVPPPQAGRGIAALAADTERSRWNTRSVSSFELAEHDDLTDADGSRPDSWGFITAMETTPVAELDVADYR